MQAKRPKDMSNQATECLRLPPSFQATIFKLVSRRGEDEEVINPIVNTKSRHKSAGRGQRTTQQVIIRQTFGLIDSRNKAPNTWVKYNRRKTLPIRSDITLLALVTLGVLALSVVSLSNQQLIFSSAPARDYQHIIQQRSSSTTSFTQQPSQEFSLSTVPNTYSNHQQWRSHHNHNHDHQQQHPSGVRIKPPAATTEARGALSRNFYSGGSRGARNASLSSTSGAQNSWHFPRISPEHAAEVLLTGAQVINRIAQAETPLNYCRTPDDQDGECSDIRKCIWLVLDKARLKQSVCLRNLIIPAVCCPVSNANNTPIANMIQSTLEPVLFRPKAPKPKKQPLGSSPMRPFASIVDKTVIGMPPPSPVSMINRQPNATSVSVLATTTAASSAIPALSTTTSTTSTTTTTTSTTHAPTSQIMEVSRPESAEVHTTLTNDPIKSQGSSNTLFQDENARPMTKVNNQYNRTISQRYPWANETCGEGSRTRTSRIVGGTDSKLGQWPWMTAMYLNKRSSFSSAASSSNSAGEFWCGGALINRRFILTAAHCLSDQRGNKYKNDQVTIKLGGVDLVRHQAPLDILRNIELESRINSHMEPLAATDQHQHQVASRGASRGTRSQTSARRALIGHSRSEDDDEEFSWTSFITKALGLAGLTSSSSSSSASSSSSSSGSISNTQATSLAHSPSEGSSTKSLSADHNRKQLLAAHAKKTYFREYKVANIKQHPKFQRHGFYNDIGLIELKSDVEYDDLISPICLPTEYDLKRDLTSYMATVLGWGTLSYGGQGSKLLQQVSMPVWSNKDCDERYLQHIGKTFLCAGFLTGGKDACQGDSGGPLMIGDNSGRWTLHGVVSFGKTCAQANYPGVYTRVTEYLDWIRDNTDIEGYSSGLSSQNKNQKKI